MKKLTISLIEPQIPPNTGNIARLCASNNLELHLVGKCGFDLSDKYLKRAGMDYWDHVNYKVFPNTDDYFKNLTTEKIHLLTSKRQNSYTNQIYQLGDYLIFGSETTGLSDSILEKYNHRTCTIPMVSDNDEIRCLNLSTCVGIVAYEAMRQLKVF